MALNVGSRLGHYDVTSLLGEGGMGLVWQATDTQLNRQVGQGVLKQEFVDLGGCVPSSVEKFWRSLC